MQVYTRLHKLNLCASHRDTITSLDILGNGYDTKVMLWSNALTPRITSKTSVSIILLCQYTTLNLIMLFILGCRGWNEAVFK